MLDGRNRGRVPEDGGGVGRLNGDRRLQTAEGTYSTEHGVGAGAPTYDGPRHGNGDRPESLSYADDSRSYNGDGAALVSCRYGRRTAELGPHTKAADGRSENR